MTRGHPGGSWRRGAHLLARATTPGDRLLMALSALAIAMAAGATLGRPGATVAIYRDNVLLHTLPLDTPRRLDVAGELGPVTVEIGAGRARLREFRSPRLVGTRTGWISRRGEVAACVPCGVVLKITGDGGGAAGTAHRGGGDAEGFDALAR